MADCTVAEIMEDVRAELGDTSTPGGGDLDDQFQTSFFVRAYEELFARLSLNGAASLRKTVYYNLPPDTGILTPAQLVVQDLSEPEALWERGSLVSFAITGTSISTSQSDYVVVTAAGYTFAKVW